MQRKVFEGYSFAHFDVHGKSNHHQSTWRKKFITICHKGRCIWISLSRSMKDWKWMNKKKLCTSTTNTSITLWVLSKQNQFSCCPVNLITFHNLILLDKDFGSNFETIKNIESQMKSARIIWKSLFSLSFSWQALAHMTRKISL